MSAPHGSEDALVQLLREASWVMAFCGAGVSAESGVPTFRGAGGLWEGHRVEDVATPEAFERNPQLVWRFYALRQTAMENVGPNPAHLVLAAMERRYPDFLLVTQNIDNLHERAGSKRMIKIHGSLMETRCSACERVESIDEPVSIAEVEAGDLPHCECGGLLRPNVVWFGELLDPRHFARIYDHFERCPRIGTGVLLVIGTSGEVSGGYGLTGLARRHGVRVVEINPQRSALTRDADLAITRPAGELLARVWKRVEQGG